MCLYVFVYASGWVSVCVGRYEFYVVGGCRVSVSAILCACVCLSGSVCGGMGID